jgi:Ca-activated chloride channel family protein
MVTLKRRSIGILFALFVVAECRALFDNYNAHNAYLAHDLSKAGNLLEKKIASNPHDPQTLYNAGVVAYKQDKFAAAQAYFNSASQADDMQLKETALFNRGNSEEKLGHLEDAVKSYEAVLKINPQNERAAHNLAIVKKMLEQKKQQEQKKKQEEQEKEKKEKEQQNQNKGGSDKEQQDKNKSDEKQKQSEQEKKQKEGQKNDAQNGSNEQKDQKQNDKQAKKQPKDETDNKREHGQNPQEESGKQEESKQQSDGHTKKPPQKSPAQNTAKQEKEQALQKQLFNDKPETDDPRLNEEERQLLKIVQEAQENVHKELIKDKINQIPAASDKNW